MKQLLILSGKGGTGKTTVASAFIKTEHARAYADCDVDAPNLHLVLEQINQPQVTDYYGMPKAEINPDLCAKCDRCREHCRFDAVLVDDGCITLIHLPVKAVGFAWWCVRSGPSLYNRILPAS